MKRYFQIQTDAKFIGELNTICAVKGITQSEAFAYVVGEQMKVLAPEVKKFESEIKDFEARVKRFREAQSPAGVKIYHKRKASKRKAR